MTDASATAPTTGDPSSTDTQIVHAPSPALQTQNTSQTNPPVAHAPSPDTTSVILDNAPLGEAKYPPSNATKLPKGSGPTVLRSLGELADLTAEVRAQSGYSNFAQMSIPNNNSGPKPLAWLDRFASLNLTQFSNDIASPRLTTGGPNEPAELLAFPVNVATTDGSGITLPGLLPAGVSDSKGYPLFYDHTRKKKTVGTRSTGALFPVVLSRDLKNRFKTYPDPQSVRVWAQMFSLSGDTDASTILLQRVRSAAAGDNHIMLLVKAFLTYFDAIAATVQGVSARRDTVSADDHVVNITRKTGWVAQTISSSKEIVNVLGGSSSYQEFWAYCCFDTPPIYASKETDGKVLTTPFSHTSFMPPTKMVCLCDSDAFSTTGQPSFFANPTLALGFIEMYVQRYSLHNQAREALQIAMHWPAICQTGAHISLPRPMHTADWLGGECESEIRETDYETLLSHGHLTVLASSLASGETVCSQLFDLITLAAADRESKELDTASMSRATRWLTSRIASAGTGWRFILSQPLDLSPSFLYITGLANEVVPWERIVASTTVTSTARPLHLRLLQSLWVTSSVPCMLPWHATWLPEFTVEGSDLVADLSTIARLRTLGVLGASSPETPSEVALRARTGKQAVAITESTVMDRLRVIQTSGIKIAALFSRETLAG